MGMRRYHFFFFTEQVKYEYMDFSTHLLDKAITYYKMTLIFENMFFQGCSVIWPSCFYGTWGVTSFTAVQAQEYSTLVSVPIHDTGIGTSLFILIFKNISRSWMQYVLYFIICHKYQRSIIIFADIWHHQMLKARLNWLHGLVSETKVFAHLNNLTLDAARTWTSPHSRIPWWDIPRRRTEEDTGRRRSRRASACLWGCWPGRTSAPPSPPPPLWAPGRGSSPLSPSLWSLPEEKKTPEERFKGLVCEIWFD